MRCEGGRRRFSRRIYFHFDFDAVKHVQLLILIKNHIENVYVSSLVIGEIDSSNGFWNQNQCDQWKIVMLSTSFLCVLNFLWFLFAQSNEYIEHTL